MNCKTAQPLLSEYLDDRLSGRETWELDRHLTECHHCTRALNEMRRTVEALSAAPRFAVSDDFMQSLQARLEGLEPAPARRAWLTDLREALRPRVLPAWGAALGACALVAILLAPHRRQVEMPVHVIPSALGPSVVQVVRNQNVAQAAADPFADLASANLAATEPGP